MSRVVLSVALVIVLNACSGGGNGGGMNTAANNTATNTPPSSTIVATIGSPTKVAVTRDGATVFVSVSNIAQTVPPSSLGNSGIEIFKPSPTGLQVSGFVPLTDNANEIALLPDQSTLVVALSNSGVALIDVNDALLGNATPFVISQGASAGTFDVAVSPDGNYVFVANEYGALTSGGVPGNIGVIKISRDVNGRATGTALGNFATGASTVVSLALSQDGSRLYVASEVLPTGSGLTVGGNTNPQLTKTDCVQSPSGPTMPNGIISVIDVSQAIVAATARAIITNIAAGCSPVRMVLTSDQKTLWVTARGDNKILSFDRSKLEADTNNALISAIDSGGSAPVGITLLNHDGLAAVANSNRFTPSTGNANLSFIDITQASTTGIVHQLNTGLFPRDLTLSTDGATLYLTNYLSNSIQVIQNW